jgi:hypothetical protein
MYVCISPRTNIHAHTRRYVYLGEFLCVYHDVYEAYTVYQRQGYSVCMCVVYIHTHTHTHIYIYIYILYVHTYIYIHIFSVPVYFHLHSKSIFEAFKIIKINQFNDRD